VSEHACFFFLEGAWGGGRGLTDSSLPIYLSRTDLKYPIIFGVSDILDGKISPKGGLTDLMSLPLRTEMYECSSPVPLGYSLNAAAGQVPLPRAAAAVASQQRGGVVGTNVNGVAAAQGKVQPT
jgi:hypothetical protein